MTKRSNKIPFGSEVLSWIKGSHMQKGNLGDDRTIKQDAFKQRIHETRTAASIIDTGKEWRMACREGKGEYRTCRVPGRVKVTQGMEKEQGLSVGQVRNFRENRDRQGEKPSGIVSPTGGENCEDNTTTEETAFRQGRTPSRRSRPDEPTSRPSRADSN